MKDYTYSAITGQYHFLGKSNWNFYFDLYKQLNYINYSVGCLKVI